MKRDILVCDVYRVVNEFRIQNVIGFCGIFEHRSGVYGREWANIECFRIALYVKVDWLF